MNFTDLLESATTDPQSTHAVAVYEYGKTIREDIRMFFCKEDAEKFLEKSNFPKDTYQEIIELDALGSMHESTVVFSNKKDKAFMEKADKEKSDGAVAKVINKADNDTGDKITKLKEMCKCDGECTCEEEDKLTDDQNPVDEGIVPDPNTDSEETIVKKLTEEEVEAPVMFKKDGEETEKPYHVIAILSDGTSKIIAQLDNITIANHIYNAVTNTKVMRDMDYVSVVKNYTDTGEFIDPADQLEESKDKEKSDADVSKVIKKADDATGTAKNLKEGYGDDVHNFTFTWEFEGTIEEIRKANVEIEDAIGRASGELDSVTATLDDLDIESEQILDDENSPADDDSHRASIITKWMLDADKETAENAMLTVEDAVYKNNGEIYSIDSDLDEEYDETAMDEIKVNEQEEESEEDPKSCSVKKGGMKDTLDKMIADKKAKKDSGPKE